MSRSRWKLLLGRATILAIAPGTIQTIEPGVLWGQAATGEAALGTGGALPALNTMPLTDGGVGWPMKPAWRANIGDWFFMPEDDDGGVVYLLHDIGNDAGWNDTLFDLEGRTVPVTPGFYTVQGKVMFGSAIRVRGHPSRWGWANLTWRIRPKRGFEAMHTVRVWLNRNNNAARPTYWVDLSAAVNGTGSEASPFNSIPAVGTAAYNDRSRLVKGWHINLKAGEYVNIRGDFTNELINEGPITMSPAPGTPKTTVCLAPGDVATLEINQQRVSWFDIQSALYPCRGFSCPRARSVQQAQGYKSDGTYGTGLGGYFYMRDGCSPRDARGLADFATARAGGPYSFGVMEGFENLNPARQFQFWNSSTLDNVGFIGSLANPIVVKMSHALSGVKIGWGIGGGSEFAWSCLYFPADDRFSNCGMLEVEMSAHGQFWGRKHKDVWLSVTGAPIQETLSGSWGSLQMWKVPINSAGQNMQNFAPVNGRTILLSDGSATQPAITFASSEYGQVWGRVRNGATNCKPNPLPGWGNGRTWNEAGIILDGIGPPLYPNRQGNSSYEAGTTDFGFCVLGWDPNFIYLLNDPGTITHISVVTGHGAHSLFLQVPDYTRGALRNYVIANSSIEHPENYIQMQHNSDAVAGLGTLSIASDGLVTLDTAQTVHEGWGIYIGSAGSGTDNSGKVFWIRHVVSSTQFYVHTDTVSTTGAVSPRLSGTVAGATFELLRGTVYGLAMLNTFNFGNAATGWNGSIYGLIIRGSTIHQQTKGGAPMIIDIRSARRQRWEVGRVTDSYLSGWTISGLAPSVWFNNNQHGRSTNLDIGGDQVTAAPGVFPTYGFGASRKGGISRLRARGGVNRVGIAVAAGVDTVGSDAS